MESKELLERSLSEIRGLRNQNSLMKARLDMFDDVMSALHGKPATPQGGAMHPDIAHELEIELVKLNRAQS